nr:isocitrate lyase [Desulfuromonadales bacterium]
MPRKPREEQVKELQTEWDTNPRWKDVKRGYTATDVVNLRGSIPHRSMLAAHGADKLWDYL